jgi:hypothetical protein
MTAEGIRGSYRLILSLGAIKQRAFAVDVHVISLLCFFLRSLRLFHSSVDQLRLSLCLPVYESPVAPLTVRVPRLVPPAIAMDSTPASDAASRAEQRKVGQWLSV